MHSYTFSHVHGPSLDTRVNGSALTGAPVASFELAPSCLCSDTTLERKWQDSPLLVSARTTRGLEFQEAFPGPQVTELHGPIQWPDGDLRLDALGEALHSLPEVNVRTKFFPSVQRSGDSSRLYTSLMHLQYYIRVDYKSSFVGNNMLRPFHKRNKWSEYLLCHVVVAWRLNSASTFAFFKGGGFRSSSRWAETWPKQSPKESPLSATQNHHGQLDALE